MEDNNLTSFDKIAVLIPCYNESVTIAKVVQDFQRVLPEATIYVYDNNSTDNTAQIAQENGAIVRSIKQQGKGNVMRAMFRGINAECYLLVDGDDTYPADNAREMILPILNKTAEMVIGDRLSATYFEENNRPFHNVGNRLVRGLINVLFKNNVRDIMTGYRAFSFNFVKTFPVLSKGFEIETEMSIHALDKHLPIETVVCEYRDRPDGSESKLNTFSDGYRVIKTIIALFKNYKPLWFLSFMALLIFSVAMFLFVPVWIEYRATGMVHRFPTLIVSGFMTLTAIILVVSGIILDVLAHQSRQKFELEYIQVDALKELLHGQCKQTK